MSCTHELKTGTVVTVISNPNGPVGCMFCEEHRLRAENEDLRGALRYCRAEAERHKKTPGAWAPAVIDRVNEALREGSYAPRSSPSGGDDAKR